MDAQLGSGALNVAGGRDRETVRRYEEAILACISTRLSNGRTEALDVKRERLRAAPTGCTAPQR